MTTASLSLSDDASKAAGRPAGAPSFRAAFVGFATSTLAVTALMVMLSAL